MNKYIITLAAALALPSLVYSTASIAQVAKAITPTPFVSDQPTGEWLAHVMFGTPVQNPAGEVIGDVNDLVFNPGGQISTVVLGIGGLLGMGEKNVAVPYSALSFKMGADGTRVIVVALTKDELKLAPAFKATEKTTYDAMKDKAIEMGKSASEKAGQLKDQAVKKIEDMKADTPKKQ
jgi:sporulation protein YlmC with PRC-barrel domain